MSYSNGIFLANPAANVLFLSPDSALQDWKPGLANADPELLDVVRRYVGPGMTVWVDSAVFSTLAVFGGL
jgi:hypothetical protein